MCIDDQGQGLNIMLKISCRLFNQDIKSLEKKYSKLFYFLLVDKIYEVEVTTYFTYYLPTIIVKSQYYTFV